MFGRETKQDEVSEVTGHFYVVPNHEWKNKEFCTKQKEAEELAAGMASRGVNCIVVRQLASYEARYQVKETRSD